MLLCVWRQCAELLDACTSHPKKKNSLGDRPIYHFHINIHFLKAPLGLRWSQGPRHSVTSYGPACPPQVIVYFRYLLESRLDFRFGACRFCADEAATAVFPLFGCLGCPWGCLVVLSYTFVCPVAMTALAMLSELPLSELDSDDVEDIPPLLELVSDELSPPDSSDLQHSGRQSSSRLRWLYRTSTQPQCVERVSSCGDTTGPQQVVLRGCQSVAGSNKAKAQQQRTRRSTSLITNNVEGGGVVLADDRIVCEVKHIGKISEACC